MNKKPLLLTWSIFCVPASLSVLIKFGYSPNGVEPVFLWSQLIIGLSGIFAMTKIPIKHLSLKILALVLYIFILLFFWLALSMTVGCANGGGCFVH